MSQIDIYGKTKTEKAIELLKFFEPAEGYYLAYSGGKDSTVIKALAEMAGVKFDAHYNLTTADPPELVKFIQSQDDVIIDKPECSMWQLIPKKSMPPTRIIRYCCEAFKERGGEGRIVITGVRWAESVRRKNTRKQVEVFGRKSKKKEQEDKIMLNSDNDEKRRLFETCFSKRKRVINPIIDWTDDDVWGFIRNRNLPYCKLYDEGFQRLGCIGCPMSTMKQKERDFERWPSYKKAYLKSFEKMIEERIRKGLKTEWKTAEEVMDWWIYGKRKKGGTK